MDKTDYFCKLTLVIQYIIELLKDGTKSGRSSQMSEEISFSIKKELKENNHQGWTTKQAEELIVKKSGIKYTISTYTASFVNGF